MASSSALSLPTVEETAEQSMLENFDSYSFLFPLSDSESGSESESDDEDYHSLLSENLESDPHDELSSIGSEPDSDFEEWIPEEVISGSDPDEFCDSDPMDADLLPVCDLQSESDFGELNDLVNERDAGSDLDLDLNPDPDWADTEELPEFLQMDIDMSQFHDLDSDLDSDDQFPAPDPNPNSLDETTDELYDCMQFDEQREDLLNPNPAQNPNQDQEWEAVSTDDSSQSDLEEMVRHLEWEVLLAVNSLYDDVAPFFDSERPAEVTFFRQLLENDGFVKGGPPASKSVVENLPSVCVSKIDCDLSCAVCKDSFLIGESVKKLPCLHDYHAKCILPWLGMRNTCPLCRYELATDDVEYDNWRANLQNRA